MPSTKFKPGQSGNPRGRPPGVGKVAQLRAAIEEHLPEIIAAQVKAAKEGNPQAARLLVDRVMPTYKPADQPTPIALPDGTLTERADAVIKALGDGEIPASQASQVLSALASLAQIQKADELAARVEALEKAHGQKS